MIGRLVACLTVVTLVACSSEGIGTGTGGPPPPPPVPIASAVVTGYESTCILTTAGSVYCWGSDSLGTLGRDSVDTLPHSVPEHVSGTQTFTALDGSGTFVCGLTTGGELWCWGTTQSFTTPVFNQILVPTAVTGAPAFTSISAGAASGCGLTSQGAAYCWGENLYGQLGTGDETGHATPALVVGGYTWSSIGVGFDHACGMTTGSQFYCWGSNLGVIGTSPVDSQTTPYAIQTPTFASFRAGAQNTCGVTTAGVGYCWGLNVGGAVGDSTFDGPVAGTSAITTPVRVVGGLTFSAIVAERENTVLSTTCGLTTQGAAYCWGYQSFGQLGDPSVQGTVIPNFGGNTSYYAVPYPVPVSGGLSFKAISVGYSHACAITTAGAVYCWGQNDRGQLGTGTTTASDVPVRVNGFGPS